MYKGTTEGFEHCIWRFGNEFFGGPLRYSEVQEVKMTKQYKKWGLGVFEVQMLKLGDLVNKRSYVKWS